MKLPISRTTAKWLLLGILAIILVWGGFTGRLGSVLGALLAPADMVVGTPGGDNSFTPAGLLHKFGS